MKLSKILTELHYFTELRSFSDKV